MACKSKPPLFNLKEKSYARYRFELECWQEVTALEKKKQATEVLLSLPETSHDESRLREYVFSKMKKEDICGEEGMKTLLELMDGLLQEDDLGRVWTAFIKFDEYKRTDNQSISDYITEFGMLYAQLETENVQLPESVQALLLIRRAALSADVVKLCLTELDYKQPKMLYKQAVCALRKFAGDNNCTNFSIPQASASFSQPGGSVQVKQEVNESASETFKTQTFRPPGQSESYRGWYQRGRGVRRGNRHPWQRGSSGDSGYKWRGAPRGQSGRGNPKNGYGGVMRCHGCGSDSHFVRNCDARDRQQAYNTESVEYNDYTNDYCDVILYTGVSDVFLSELRHEAEFCAILDSACSSTVCGERWLTGYLESVSAHQREYAVANKIQSPEIFKFGGGEQLRSKGIVNIPAQLAGKSVVIRSNVVSSDIPLLLSLDSMKRAGIILDTTQDKAEIFGESVNLSRTSSGHYCVSLRRTELPVERVHQVMVISDTKDRGEIFRKLRHLHRQFGHPCESKLETLLKNANVWDRQYGKLLSEVQSKCETCKVFRKVNKPIVALSMATRFNQVVTMDLKKRKNYWIVYFIDLFSRLCVARRIYNKKPATIVDSFMQSWIGTGYGTPDEFLMDNGGEFIGEDMMEMCSLLNVKVNTTAASCPFSNGVCERNHAVVDCMLNKLEYDHPEKSIDVLLSWACASKNAMSMYAGFSPYQIVFGRNPSVPGFNGDTHPPVTNQIKGDELLKHLKVLESSRKAFVEAESAEKVKRALRHKIRVSERDYMYGDWVYFKKELSDQWFGPAKVLFQDGKIVFIRHGTYLIRVYKNRVVLKGEEYKVAGENNQKMSEKELSGEKHLTSSETENVRNQTIQGETHYECDESPGDITADKGVSEFESTNQCVGGSVHIENEFEGSDDQGVRSQGVSVSWKSLRPNDLIRYRDDNESQWTECKVINRAGKVNGRNAGLFNVETSTNRYYVDLKVKDFEVVKNDETNENSVSNEPEVTQSGCEKETSEEIENVCVYERGENGENEVLLCNKEKIVFKVNVCEKEEQAKLCELEKLKEFETYTVVENTGQECISTRWVITEKGDGTKKARLVARGFEETQKVQSDSPTVSKSLIRVFFTFCSTLCWLVKSIDVKSAYLQGKPLERQVFIKPPKGYEDPNKVWKLNKCLYGLNDGARNFYLSVKKFLLQCGCKVSNLEPAVFVYQTQGKIQGLIVSHVDDFLYGGTLEFNDKVIKPLVERYKASRQVAGRFQYVGLSVEQCQSLIKVEQNKYAHDLSVEGIPLNKGEDRELNSEEYTTFRKLVGQINWLVNGTRPDLAFQMIELSTKFNCAKLSHLKLAIKAVRKVKSECIVNVFPKLRLEEGLSFVVFTDASLGNLNGADSCGGHVVFMTDKYGNSSVISWHSGKIKRVVRSTLAAETMALLAGLEESIYLRHVVKFCTGLELPILAIVDNKSLVQSIGTTHLVEEKKLRIDICAVKEMIEKDCVTVKWVPGNKQLANCLTKGGAESISLLNVVTSGKLPDV